MKRGIRTEADWDLVGSELARLGDDDQIKFFKAFVKECNTWGTNWQVSQQLACINRGLTKEEIEQLSQITYNEDNDK